MQDGSASKVPADGGSDIHVRRILVLLFLIVHFHVKLRRAGHGIIEFRPGRRLNPGR